MADAPHPATSLLFTEWEPTDAEITNGETPTRVGDPALGIKAPTSLGLLPAQYQSDVVPIDPSVYANAAKWQKLWMQVIQASKRAPHSK